MTQETLLMVLEVLAKMEAAVEAAESDDELDAVVQPFLDQLWALRTDAAWPVRRLP